MIIYPSIYEDNNVHKDLYSKLYQKRIVFVFGEITDEMSATVIAQLLYLDSISNDDITLYINSQGGSVTAGLAILDTMNYIKSGIRTICIGLAASMASLLLACGDKGKRFALPNSEMLIHQPLGGVSGQASDIEIVSNRIIAIRNKLNNMLANATGQTVDKISKDTERDYYLTSEQAVKYGLIDFITMSC